MSDEAMTPGHIAARAHDHSLFGDETPVPWGEPDSPAVAAWEAAAEAVTAPVRAERDKAYSERAALVAFVAACYRSVIVAAPRADPDPWPVLFADTSEGQVSW